MLRLSGTAPLGAEEAYLQAGVLASYWTTITFPGLLATAVASIAGAVLLAANRSVLTAGVMIALALVPSAAIVGASLAIGDLSLAGQALLRWAADVAAVAVLSAAVFGWKRRTIHRRSMKL